MFLQCFSIVKDTSKMNNNETIKKVKTTDSVNIAVTNKTVYSQHDAGVDWLLVAYVIRQYSCPILFLIGFAGNLLTSLILGQKRNRKSSMAVFLLVLAMSDTIVLFVGYFCEWILLIWNYDIRAINGFTCKLSMFLTYFSLQYSSWILVIVTIERAVGVVVPYKVRVLCSRKRGIILPTVTAALLGLANGHFLVGVVSGYNPYNMRNCTVVSDKYMEFLVDEWAKFDFIISFATPFVFIVAGNTIMIFKLTRTARQRKHLVASEPKNSSLTLMLLLLSVVFIVCTGPSAIYSPLIFPKLVETLDISEMAIPIFLFDIFNILAGLNATLNFVLYFLSGSKFRKEVKAFFCCKKTQRQGIF